MARQRPIAARPRQSHVDLLRHFERIVNLDAEIPHRALELAVPEKQLNRGQILRATVDQRCVGPTHCMRPVSCWTMSDPERSTSLLALPVLVFIWLQPVRLLPTF
jgi:hypothetical protein